MGGGGGEGGRGEGSGEVRHRDGWMLMMACGLFFVFLSRCLISLYVLVTFSYKNQTR
jgi:hypothetical protein